METFTAEERKKFIKKYVEENEFVDISYLKDTFSVSEMTIRRDLKKLEEEESLIRVMGGARSIQSRAFEASVDKRMRVHAAEKEKIAKYAASLVQEGDSIFLDASSTTYAMVDYLTVHATIITNNISVCIKVKDKENIDVILLGGNLWKSAMSIVGVDAIQMLQKYYVDKAFLSSKAVDEVYGISDATVEESEVKKMMIQSSEKVYFLMDHYKMEKRAFYKVCNLDQVTELITDESQDEEAVKFIANCRERGIHIQCVV